ncbi:MAG: hypothetical protein DRR08_15885 [Candidatus Parabeggiatoa sp. nov. 2]|nr:MAG: hypothetical protein B6247_25225 [Beggiatoa sp. 4572_84]RKZ58647.1 MAG: hypothetical protein DRR08_15885 [Gammaproteobacteria bacterium]
MDTTSFTTEGVLSLRVFNNERIALEKIVPQLTLPSGKIAGQWLLHQGIRLQLPKLSEIPHVIGTHPQQQ